MLMLWLCCWLNVEYLVDEMLCCFTWISKRSLNNHNIYSNYKYKKYITGQYRYRCTQVTVHRLKNDLMICTGTQLNWSLPDSRKKKMANISSAILLAKSRQQSNTKCLYIYTGFPRTHPPIHHCHTWTLTKRCVPLYRPRSLARYYLLASNFQTFRTPTETVPLSSTFLQPPFCCDNVRQ